MARAQSGERDALEELVRRHQAWIYNIAVRMLYHPQEAEDAVQEILIKALTRLSSFEGRSSFRTWLSASSSTTCSTPGVADGSLARLKFSKEHLLRSFKGVQAVRITGADILRYAQLRPRAFSHNLGCISVTVENDRHRNA